MGGYLSRARDSAAHAYDRKIFFRTPAVPPNGPSHRRPSRGPGRPGREARARVGLGAQSVQPLPPAARVTHALASAAVFTATIGV
ncbi:hypothetical protein SHO565_01940 [Streptomyces sp. HO565]